MSNINLEVDAGGVALLTLKRPDVLNALNEALMAEVTSALGRLASDDSVKAVAITGSGRAFCAGADLGAVGNGRSGDASIGESVASVMQSHFNPFMECLYQFPKPTLCAVNGIAAGGGAALALCADIVIASREAELVFVQVPRLGIVADLGANWLLPRIAGRSRALAACLLGESIDAARLLEWGLVWECVEAEALLPRVVALGEQLGRLPPQTVLATRRLIDDAHAASYADILERERLAQRDLCDLPVFKASVERFLSE
jgi:2-(1,2-epoxy-1,2-dihydrophenyl)acetyl-CoA isomerase